LRSLLGKTIDADLSANPIQLYRLVSAVSRSASQGSQSVVYVDNQRADALWKALRSDSPSIYASLHPDDTLGATPS
jgi:hypothetical protein